MTEKTAEMRKKSENSQVKIFLKAILTENNTAESEMFNLFEQADYFVYISSRYRLEHRTTCIQHVRIDLFTNWQTFFSFVVAACNTSWCDSYLGRCMSSSEEKKPCTQFSDAFHSSKEKKVCMVFEY